MRAAKIHLVSWLFCIAAHFLGSQCVVGGTIVTKVAADPLLVGAHGITTDGANLYATAYADFGTGKVLSVPISGGTVTQLYGNLFSPLGLSEIGQNLYWIDPNSGPGTGTQILAAPVARGGSISPIFTGDTIVDGSGLATDGARLFAADEVQGRVFRLNSDGSGLTQLGGSRYGGFFNNEHLNTIAVSGGTVYVADFGKSGVISPEVVSIPASGGSFTTLSSGSPFVSLTGIAVGGDSIYVADGGTNSIWSLPLSGGTPTLYASDPRFDHLNQLTWFDGALYAADSGDGMTGIIWRISSVPEPASITLGFISVISLMAYAAWSRSITVRRARCAR
jgi:hypothetical protein